MWTASTLGWFSIVRKGNGKEWHIRGRVKQDLLNLIKAANLAGQKVIETLNADYRYRLVVGNEELHRVFEALENSIDYPNFKNAVGKMRGQERHLRVYHTIWSLMSKLQDSPRSTHRLGLWDQVERGLNENEPGN